MHIFFNKTIFVSKLFEICCKVILKGLTNEKTPVSALKIMFNWQTFEKKKNWHFSVKNHGFVQFLLNSFTITIV